MADVIYEAPMGVKRVFKDMGDGTHAEVISVPGTTTPVGTQRNVRLIRVTNASQIAAGAKSVCFANTGAANATVTAAATVLKPGEVVNFVAQGGDTFSAIQYSATGTELLIAVVE